MKSFFEKLHDIADDVQRAKSLDFFGLVHAAGEIDRWDLLVSSPKLKPWSFESRKYIASLLQKSLSPSEIVQIGGIAVLPRSNKIIARLMHDEQLRPGRLTLLNDEQFDRVFIIYPDLGDEPAVNGRGERGQRHSASEGENGRTAHRRKITHGA